MQVEQDTRQLLTDYLLGRLAPAEQDALAARYFGDDDLFAELEEVEQDLLAQYVRDQLAAPDRTQFAQYLQRHPAGREKVALAQALATVCAEECAAATSAAPPAPERMGWWAMVVGWLVQPLPAAAVAGGLLLVVGLLAWVLLLNRHLAQENQQLLAAARQQQTQHEGLQQTVAELQQSLATAQDHTQQLQAVLQRAQQAQSAMPSATSPTNLGLIVTWMLRPPALRRTLVTPATMTLNRQAKTVTLQLALHDRQAYTGYHVVLQTLEDKQRVWEEHLPQTPPPQSGNHILLQRPASQFTATSYKLTLTLNTADGSETQTEYYFTVSKP